MKMFPSISKSIIKFLLKLLISWNGFGSLFKSKSTLVLRTFLTIGVIPSIFLTYPGVNRSNHPLNSVSAIGSKSLYYTSEHDFHEPEGINSPVGKLYKKNGKVLLLGVGLSSCTAIHLAEYIADVDYLYNDNPVVLKDNIEGLNNFVQIKKYPGTSEFFDQYITELNDKDYFINKKFGLANIIIFEIKPVIDFFVAKLQDNPHCLIKPKIINESKA